MRCTTFDDTFPLEDHSRLSQHPIPGGTFYNCPLFSAIVMPLCNYTCPMITVQSELSALFLLTYILVPEQSP